VYGKAMTTTGGVSAAALPFTGGHVLALFVGGSALLFAGLALRALAPNRHRDDGL
jgi:hypothetical protein